MSIAFEYLPNARDPGARDWLESKVSLIRRAFDLAAAQPYGFTFEDLEQIEAYRTRHAGTFSAPAVNAVDCVASLTDGRRFHLAYGAGPHQPERVTVTQLMTDEPFPSIGASDRLLPWIDDVAELNHRLGLPLIPPGAIPVILPLPARY